MNKIIGVLIVTAVLVGCGDSGNINTSSGVHPISRGGSAMEATKPTDVRAEVWLQLSKEAKAEIVGSWQSGKVSRVTVDSRRFLGAEKYMGKELLVISFTSKRAALGDVSVFVDPQTHKIVGYGLRD